MALFHFLQNNKKVYFEPSQSYQLVVWRIRSRHKTTMSHVRIPATARQGASEVVMWSLSINKKVNKMFQSFYLWISLDFEKGYNNYQKTDVKMQNLSPFCSRKRVFFWRKKLQTYNPICCLGKAATIYHFSCTKLRGLSEQLIQKIW